MGHEITFQEVTGGGSSDVKSIEINIVGGVARARVEYEREDVESPRTPIDRAPACRYARGNKSAQNYFERFL